MLTILEYLYINSRYSPVSKYHIMTKVRDIKKQRPDRITFLLDKLEQNHYIYSFQTSNAKFYTITENGIDEYVKWVKNFLMFVRKNNNMIE